MRPIGRSESKINFVQHSAHIGPGREGLFDLIKSLPSTLKYEPGTIVAEGDLLIVHGRFSDFGLPVNWIAAGIVRIKDGILVEHWDVIQDEATEEQSLSKRPMFGTTFPTYGLATVFNAPLDVRLAGQSSIGRESIQSPSALSTLEFVDTSTWEEIIRILEESSI